MEIGDLVREHYGRSDLEAVVLAALQRAGRDPERLTAEDLAPVDELHAGGLPATRYLLEHLELTRGSRLLDVGCGIGGPARIAAVDFGCSVHGVDLSPDFVRTAQHLTERVGLASLVQHRVASGDALDLEDGSVDRAMLVHVGMNIADKAAVFAEVRRVLVPGGIFGLFEQMQTGDGTPTYPLPWADDPRTSFLVSPEGYADLLGHAGFEVRLTENRTSATTPQGPPPATALSPATVFGPGFSERLAHNIAATRAGVVEPVLMLARAR
jgi:MPBQ/MSBQ methyltransferase